MVADKMKVIDLSKQQALNAMLNQSNKTNSFYWNYKEAKETILDFSQGTVRVLKFILVLYNINTK